jgi:hypothetical protein
MKTNDNLLSLAAIAHSKHRNAIGLVGVEIDTELRQVYVKLARQWSRDMINEIPYKIAKLFNQIRWGNTFIDQLTGQHFISELKREHHLPIRIINTQKNLKEPDDIERIEVMDKIEMTQFMVVLKKNHQVLFPDNPSKTMKELESQMAIYSEHKSEAGNIDYYAPGDEKDNLTKALLMNCFAARKYLQQGKDSGHVIGQVAQQFNYMPMRNTGIGFN